MLGRYFERHEYEYDQQKEGDYCVAKSTAAAQRLSFLFCLFVCLSAFLGYLLYSTDNPTE
jgi:hypothetical protein